MIVTGIADEPLHAADLVTQIRAGTAGAIVTFEGRTRSPSEGRVVERLRYEAWVERAEDQLRSLAEGAQARWGLEGVVAVHRVGDVPVGEPSVVVAAAAAHRAEAFEAARWLIDELKATVAIWKKEMFADGERWVGIPSHPNV